MNTTSSELWRLIQSMNRNEKLFFKKKFSGDPNRKATLYLELFNAMAAQKKYDENSLLQQLAPVISKKNIAFQKHYLHRQVCNCLVEYNNRDNVEQEIYRDIQLLRITRKKGLLNEALLLWEKTINRARKVELFSMIQLLKKEFENLILFSNARVGYDDLHTLFRSNIITYDEYAEMISLRDLYTEILMLKRKAHFDFDDELKKEIEQLLQKIALRKHGLQSRSFWFRHYTRMCHATLYYLSHVADASLSLIRDAVTDWWENRDFIETDTEHYIELLYMVNYAGIMHGSFEYVEFVFNHPANELIEEEGQKAHFEAVKYLALNKVYNKTARYGEVSKLVRNMKTKYIKWEPLLSAELNRSVCFSLGIACFVLDRYTESLQFIKRGTTYFKDGTRPEQFIFANLFLLLVLYNMNNAKLFDAQHKSTYSFFYKKAGPGGSKRRPRTSSLQKTLMDCLQETFYLTGGKEKRRLFQQAVDELELNRDNEVQEHTLNIFNFHGWLLSQVQRISYKEYVQKKYADESGTKISPVSL